MKNLSNGLCEERQQDCLFPVTPLLVKMGDRKVLRLSCPPEIQNILPLNMAKAHAAAILDGL